jgi:hypothetical protein
MKKLRAYTKKGCCLDCGNSSTHKKTCPWAYVPEPDSKARYKKNLRFWKIKAIIKILKKVL